MADKKISQLGATSVPVSPDLFAIVQSGVTKKITFADLKAGILNSGSLTAGAIPYWDGTNFSDSGFIQDSGVIYFEGLNYLSSEDGASYLDFGDGQYADLAFEGPNNAGEFLLDDTKCLINHNAIINFNSPLYNFNTATASTVPYFDASKNLVSSPVTPTELGYLSGATSNIQDQIDALSYSGTTNRITITAGVIDIAATYAGQSSITTLGTIGTGVWQGTVIGSNYGGAGTINGILKADGSGIVSLATAGTDYVDNTSNIFYLRGQTGAVGNPADGATYFFGCRSLAITTSTAGGASPIYFPENCTLVSARVTFVQTAGSNETSTISVGINNSSFTTISSSVVNNTTVTTYTQTFNIAGTTSDYIEFRWACATWATTNPASVTVSWQLGFKRP
jgi:hypothetical protein